MSTVDQDQEAIDAYTIRETARRNVIAQASDSERTVRNLAYALRRELDRLIDDFSCGERVDAKQLDALGAQIAAAVGVVNEMRAADVPALKAA
jgi:predicted RNA-binding Zn ribbon-like protein